MSYNTIRPCNPSLQSFLGDAELSSRNFTVQSKLHPALDFVQRAFIWFMDTVITEAFKQGRGCLSIPGLPVNKSFFFPVQPILLVISLGARSPF